MKRATCILAALSTIALAALPASAAAFPWFSDPFTGVGSDCNALSDPVNLAFKGTNAWASDVDRTIRVHAGWSNTSGGDQSLGVGSAKACTLMQYQVASGSFSRFHVRLWRIPGTSGASKLAADAVHHEDFVAECPGHAVDSNGDTGSGFDWADASSWTSSQSGGHEAVGRSWGNTVNFQQCDGDFARSNGVGVVVTNDHRH